MPAFRRTLSIGAVTSYDRTEGNDDGFSGKYSYVRKEGDDLVLADLKGPGCIYRIHTPTPTDDPLEFYFDGETTPRIKTTFNQLFSGKLAPFARPLVDGAGGGFYCYYPLEYKKSCKILLKAKTFQFYDINYATYPSDAPVKTFDPGNTSETDVAKACEVFGGTGGDDLSDRTTPSGFQRKTTAFDKSLLPGGSVTLFETKRGGRIAGLRIGPASAFAGKDRDIFLRVTWDKEKKSAIFCPAGDFFGYGWGKPAAGSKLIGTRGETNYCYLPMPFDHSAKIELVSLRTSGQPLSVRGEVITADAPRKPYEGKFYAVWHRENPTTSGQPFTWLNTEGRGHVVGLALQSQGMAPASTEFFEGDDQTTADSELVVHGTGSEDFFNGGWYDVPGRWDHQMARALSGCMGYHKYLSRTGAYRFFIGDAYSYRDSILQTIEHGPEKNAYLSDYAGMAYFYSEKPPTYELKTPTLTERRVVDPTEIVFAAHWAVPIAAFAFAEATLSRKNVPADAGQVRCLSMRAKGGDFFGPPFISLTCDLPAAGKYKVYIDAVKGPEQGKVQIFRDETPVGEAVDLYSEKPAAANRIYLGEITATEGPNDVMFKIVGKNVLSPALGFDIVNIICVRSPD